MIYAIYGLFKTVKMTFNTCEKKMMYRGSLCKKYLQDWKYYPPFFLFSSLQVSIII